ncbi:hypothetical protein [Acanthopleuribacter pedis]|uniref:Uncharacterized protein n=1 Tax=Acanthopleuribacter pedis TaxID=442870 RepID=A0A8J7U1W7_9BACT|nr:hypothetical protein [Acanthopleuribacter pedis]MBO1317972.1 hypothetical protein [Acanthopleuribacter pedis]
MNFRHVLILCCFCFPVFGTRFINVDPERENFSPYLYVANQPLTAIDPDGKNAKVVVDEKAQTITVSAKIVVWGDAADEKTAKMMEKNINAAWNGHVYEDTDKNKTYNVVFDVKVLYEKERPTNYKEKAKRNPELNYVELRKEFRRSETFGNGFEGIWKGNDQVSPENDPAPHEFGHLIGLDDKYTSTAPFKGWDGNIMGMPAMMGVVEKKNIHMFLKPAMEKHHKNMTRLIPRKKTVYHIKPRNRFY